MPLDLKGLTRNKPAMIGLAAAAGVGGYAFYKSRQSGATATDTSSGQAAGSGVFSSTGTDLATAIGDLGAGLQQQLNDYLGNLQQSPGAGAIPPKPDVTIPPGERHVPFTPHLGLHKTKGDTARNWGWFTAQHASLGGIASKYHVSLAELIKLNPSLPKSGFLRPGTHVRLSSDVGAYKR